jgi:hypothetical protein
MSVNIRPVLMALAFGGAVGFLVWKLGPENPARAQQEIQGIYDRQDAGWAAKDMDGICTNIDSQAIFTDMHGNSQPFKDFQSDVNSTLYHGHDFQMHAKIVSFTPDGNTATVLVEFHNDYMMHHTSMNSDSGDYEPFHEDVTSLDVWQRQIGEWWEVKSTTRSDRYLRSGVPVTPA